MPERSDSHTSGGPWAASLIAAIAAFLGAFVWLAPLDQVEVGIPRADDYAERVVRSVEGRGWVPSRRTARGEVGEPYAWPPGYDFALTVATRRAAPDVGWLMTPEAEREPVVPAGALEYEEAGAVAQRAPRYVRAGTAAIAAGAAVAAATRVAGASGMAGLILSALSAIIATGAILFAPLAAGHRLFAALLHVLMLAVLARGLAEERLRQPFWSALRGALAGFLGGYMVITWTPSILWVGVAEVAMGIRLFVRFSAPDGSLLRAPCLPVFATSFHKVALLVVLPAATESPAGGIQPWGILDLSWFHIAWLSIGWLVFAPYALAPRAALNQRGAAMLPAGLVLLALLVMTQAPAELTGAMARLTDMTVGWGKSLQALIGAAALLVTCAGIVAVRRAPSVLPWVTALPAVGLVVALQGQLSFALAAPLGVAMAIVLALPFRSK